MSRNVKPDTTVYSAAIWWRDSDPIFNVVATTWKACERYAMKAMRQEARDAYHEQYSEPRTLSDLMDDVCWSGVCPFELSDLATGRELEDAIQDLNASGVCYLSR